MQAGDVPLRRAMMSLVAVFGCAAFAISTYGDTTTSYVITCAVGYVALMVWAHGLSRRASDAIIDDDGLTIEAGPHDNASFVWSEIDAASSRIARPANERNDHLWVTMRDGREVPIAKGSGEKELASLAVLAQIIEASPAWRSHVSPPDRARGTPSRARTSILTCSSCGAHLRPIEELEACDHCGADVAVPDELLTRIRQTRAATALHARVGTLVGRLLTLPGARYTNRLLLVSSLVMLVCVPVSIFSYEAHRSAAIVSGGIAAVAYLFGRMHVVDRFALRVVLVAFAATAPLTQGEPEKCRRCDGPLPDGGQGVVCTCVYCETDNVLGIDLGIQRDLSEAHLDLTSSLGFRARDRAVSLIGMAVAAITTAVMVAFGARFG